MPATDSVAGMLLFDERFHAAPITFVLSRQRGRERFVNSHLIHLALLFGENTVNK